MDLTLKHVRVCCCRYAQPRCQESGCVLVVGLASLRILERERRFWQSALVCSGERLLARRRALQQTAARVELAHSLDCACDPAVAPAAGSRVGCGRAASTGAAVSEASQ